MLNIDIKKLVEQNIEFEARVKNLLAERFSAFDSLIELYSILNNIYPSYLAPAYHLNMYNQLVNDLYSIGIFDSLNGKQQHAILQIEFQDTLIAIKGLLDRLVKIAAVYYKDITINTTFGFYDSKTGKKSKFMSHVLQRADKDEYMGTILKEYDEWIHKAVGPRDKVIHYNDLPIVYRILLDSNNPTFETIEFVHLNKDLNEGVVLEDNEQVDNIAFDNTDLVKFVNRLYGLYNLTVNTMIDKFK